MAVIMSVSGARGEWPERAKGEALQGKVDLTAADLDGVVADDKEENPGAYVHWNLDNDDSSNNSSGSPKHCGGDYLQNAKVTGEDDLEPLTMSLTPNTLKKGTVVLSVSNAKAKIWSDSEKGNSAALVISGSGSESWDLSDDDEKTKFENFCNNGLYVEGVAREGVARPPFLNLLALKTYVLRANKRHY